MIDGREVVEDLRSCGGNLVETNERFVCVYLIN